MWKKKKIKAANLLTLNVIVTLADGAIEII